jgi:hypothetical protein
MIINSETFSFEKKTKNDARNPRVIEWKCEKWRRMELIFDLHLNG